MTTDRAKLSVPRWLRAAIPAILILLWFGLGAVGGSSFGKINDVASNDRSDQLPVAAEATRAQKLEAEFRVDQAVPGIVVFYRAGGLTDDDQRAIAEVTHQFAGIDGVSARGISPPIVAEDGAAAQVVVPIAPSADLGAVVTKMRNVVALSTGNGLAAYVTGPAGLAADLFDAFSGIDGLLLSVALIAVFIILIFVYRSPLLPIVVLLTSVFALAVAVFVVVALAEAKVLALSGQTQGILFILVIGAATDYSLLYVSRYREALRDFEGRWQATVAAVRGSWEPILASGGTVIAALLILLVSQLGSNKGMGPVGAIGIGFAMLSALTFLPAMLLALGRAAFWPVRPHFGSPHPEIAGPNAKGIWPKIGRLVSSRPRVVWVTCTALLAVAALGILQLKADGVSQTEFVLGKSQARDGQAVLSAHFPGGTGTPAIIIAPEADVPAVARAVQNNAGVASVAAFSADSPTGSVPLTPDGQRAPAPGNPNAAPTVVNGHVMLQATLTAPGDSLAAEHTVTQLRADLAQLNSSGEILVGGTAAVALDTNTAAIHDRNLIIPLVLGAILLILMLLLRAVVAPLLLIGSVVLSFGTALGVSALVFNHVFNFPGADPSVPMFGFVFLVALGIDYNIFLMTRVREESARHGTHDGIVRGLVTTGGVITSAGVVLAATFAALGVLPILFLAQLAFMVAFGVLLDTFVVRTLLIPAVSYDIGAKIWWPSALSRAA